MSAGELLLGKLVKANKGRAYKNFIYEGKTCKRRVAEEIGISQVQVLG